MMRWVLLSVAVVALAAAATFVVQFGTGANPTWELPAGESEARGPLPKVEIDGSLTHEFGPMPTQKVGTHKWTVHNRGEGNLEIWLSGSTCVCTVAKLSTDGSRETVKPGASTEIEVEWKTKDMVGEFGKNVTIATNDPRRPEFNLNVHGLVHNPIVVIPQPQENAISLGMLSNDETFRSTLAVFSPSRPEMKISKVTTSRPDLIIPQVVALSPAELEQLKTKGGYKVELQVKPGLPQGNLREELIIESDHPDLHKLQYTLTGMVTGPISVVPASLRTVVVSGKKGGRNELTLLVREGRSTKFTIAHKPEKVEVSLDSNETPSLKGRYRLTVTVPAGSAPFQVEDQIILKTDHPRVSELKIPVSIVVGSG